MAEESVFIEGAGFDEAIAEQTKGTRQSFAIAILGGLGAPMTQENIDILLAWMGKENTKATNNPLATTQGQGNPEKYGGDVMGDDFIFNSHKVKNYPDFDTGVRATVDTINLSWYSDIKRLLMKGNVSIQDFNRQAIDNLKLWGTWQVAEASIHPNAAIPDIDTLRSFEGVNKASRIAPYTRAVEVDGEVFLGYEVKSSSHPKKMSTGGGKGGFGKSFQGPTVWIKYEGDAPLVAVDKVDNQTWDDEFLSDPNNILSLLPYDLHFEDSQNWDVQVEEVLYSLGVSWLEDYEDDLEVLAIVGKIIAGYYTDPATGETLSGVFLNDWQQTELWNSKTENAQLWDSSSEAEKESMLMETATMLLAAWNANTGENLRWIDFDSNNDGTVSTAELESGNPEMYNHALSVANGSVGIETVQLQWIYPAAEGMPESPRNRLLRSEEVAQNEFSKSVSTNKGDVIETFDKWGVEIADSTAQTYANELYMGTMSDFDVEQFARSISNGLYVHKPEDVDFDTWSSVYATNYSAMLGVSPPTYKDEAFVDMLNGDEAVNLRQFKKKVRQDERWKESSDARETYSRVYSDVGRLMGFQMTTLDEIRGLFPWAETLGMTEFISELIMEGATSYEIVAQVRASDQYKQMFPGMIAEDGTRRFQYERDYLEQVDNYRTVLQQAGMYNADVESPLDYVEFMASNIAPDELRERITVYQQIQMGSQELKDQFYIYAGMEITDDDLFEAVINPEFGQELRDEFDRTVAAGDLDYATYISRATERGLANVSDLLQGMRDEGLVSGEAVQRIRDLDPDFAREVMGVIANQGTSTLGYDALSYAFQYALLGSAATEQGLTAPSAEMVERLRAAGVDRSKAMAAYGAYANTQNLVSGMVQRATGEEFGQKEFEEAVLLGEARSVDLLDRARGLEQSYARRSGGFTTGQEGSRFTQSGRTRYQDTLFGCVNRIPERIPRRTGVTNRGVGEEHEHRF